MVEPLSPSESRSLLRQREELFPFSRGGLAQEVLPRTDPVVTVLSTAGTEQEYDTMERTSDATAGAIGQRRTGVLEEGSRVQPSPRQTPAASRLHRYAVAALQSIQSWPSVRMELLYAVFRGWHPALIRWESRVIDGELLTVPTRVLPLEPWHFAVTRDGHLHQRTGEGSPRTFDGSVDQYRFAICRAGNPGKPYGSAELRKVWLPYFLSNRFRAGSWQQLNRSLGVPKASKRGGGDASINDAAVRDEIEGILTYLNHQNVLVELGGWTLEMLTVPDAARNTVDLLNFWDTRIRITLLGGNLTSEVKGGSFAAAQTHMEVRRSIVRSDAREEEGWVNDQILARGMALNFGEVDPGDAPRWRNLATLPASDPERVKIFVDLGGELDAEAVAARWGLPVTEGSGGTLRRQPGPAAPAAPAVAGGRPEPGRLRAQGDAEDDPAAILGTYYQRLTDRTLERNPDPKAARPGSGRSPSPATSS